MTSESEALHQVYAAKSRGQLADAYAAWSNGYDAETLALGYCLPFIIAGWIARYVPRGDGPILDAGCGTGLTGPYLRALGYDDIEGLDMSAEMLDLARRRGAYSALTKAALGAPLPLPDGRFAATFSTGVFTEGHAPASSLDELARVTRPGGHVVFTVRTSIEESGGFPAVFDALASANRWQCLEESPPFRAFALAEPDVLVKTYVFAVQ